MSEICSSRKTKRSTIRIRKYYRNRRLNRKLLISAIVNVPNDVRYYPKVSFLNFSEYGLIDTGVCITCIGSKLAEEDFSKFSNFTKCKMSVKTAVG